MKQPPTRYPAAQFDVLLSLTTVFPSQ